MYKYLHGGTARYINKNILDLSTNINPLGLQEGVREVIIAAIAECVFYPDSFSAELRERIAAYEGVDSSRIMCGNGASELIFRLVAALKPKKALVTAPSFLDYSRALQAGRCAVYRHQLSEEYGFELREDILTVLKKERFDLMFLCNPNNPTGVLTKRELVGKLLDVCATMGTSLVVDECFLDFIRQPECFTVKGLLNRYSNLVVIKAFTKVFALPGVRLGYLLCSNSDLLNDLYFHGPDWSVSNLAQAAGIAALQNPVEYLRRTREYLQSEKEIMKSTLTRMGFRIFGSAANYIFFKSPYPGDLAERLLRDEGICIRSCANYDGLGKGFYRIAIMQKPSNERLLAALSRASDCSAKPSTILTN